MYLLLMLGIFFIEIALMNGTIRPGAREYYVRGRDARTKVGSRRASRGSRAARTPGPPRRCPPDNRRRYGVC